MIIEIIIAVALAVVFTWFSYAVVNALKDFHITDDDGPGE